MRWRWQQEENLGDPWHNMAQDAALLTALRDGEALPTIRLYQWDRPSVSFGRLQNEDAVRQVYPQLPCVRRPTGGRAVLHGSDLTISVTVSTECLPGAGGQGVLSSYHQILGGIVAALKWVGVEAVQGSIPKTRQSHRVVNCFDWVAGCDLIDGKTGRKILGSAQRREGAALLQQMSLPLAILPDLAEFYGVLKNAFQEALEIEAWLTIDTFGPVWYTEREESEGTRRWRVKS